MMTRFLGATAVILLRCMPLDAAEPIELHKEWAIDGPFAMPESAAFDPSGEWIYVSNVNEYAKDGNGFISRVKSDGSDLQLRWLTGIHSPTGVAVYGSTLYFADYDALVEVDRFSGKIRQRYSAPDDRPSLNDVAISDAGEVYVSGSTSNSIYWLHEGRLQVWVQDDRALKQANGLLVDGDYLLQGGAHWSVYERSTRELLVERSTLVPPLADIDGITSDGCGGYLVTTIDDARLWRIWADGSAAPVSEVRYQGIDLDRVGDALVMPQVGNKLIKLQIDANCGDRPHSPN